MGDWLLSAGAGLLLCNYVGAFTAALTLRDAFRSWLMLGAHSVLAAVLVTATARLDAARYTQTSIAAFYRVIWNLLYAEYALLPWL